MTFNINDAAATFEAAVRGVSTTDPVLGGAAGEANMAATDLALRTKYLKAKLEALGAVGTWTEAQYTADGTFVVPAGVTQILVVRAKGGGGGGAGSWTSASAVHHSGGGGGEAHRVGAVGGPDHHQGRSRPGDHDGLRRDHVGHGRERRADAGHHELSAAQEHRGDLERVGVGVDVPRASGGQQLRGEGRGLVWCQHGVSTPLVR